MKINFHQFIFLFIIYLYSCDNIDYDLLENDNILWTIDSLYLENQKNNVSVQYYKLPGSERSKFSKVDRINEYFGRKALFDLYLVKTIKINEKIKAVITRTNVNPSITGIDGIYFAYHLTTMTANQNSIESIQIGMFEADAFSFKTLTSTIDSNFTINTVLKRTYEDFDNNFKVVTETLDEKKLKIEANGRIIEASNLAESKDNNNSSRNGIYVIASERKLTKEDLISLSKEELSIMRNEIFARHGYIFRTNKMKNYFNTQSWYVPKYEDVTNLLSDIERENISLIQQFEKN